MFRKLPIFSKCLEIFFITSRKSSKYLKNIWLHFINITLTVKTPKKKPESRSSKMATQISANFRILYSRAVYKKTLNNCTWSKPYLQYQWRIQRQGGWGGRGRGHPDPNIAKQNYWLKHAKLYFNFKTTTMSNKIEYSIDCLQSAFALKFV